MIKTIDLTSKSENNLSIKPTKTHPCTPGLQPVGWKPTTAPPWAHAEWGRRGGSPDPGGRGCAHERKEATGALADGPSPRP